ncbi:hypothetical protein CRE_29009 [Caenorhabditis remanei]|uniref:Acyl_transf_3 domain-containing protein n=1 Tax=Caenorhabditis remanei TaxID=31234 RepID=E3NA33_CAERE|nr:hypothetical protein CRE_29009 [Caenorhabditis remanei]
MTYISIPVASEKHTTTQKRSDLQGIRGIAILSVLGFHFLPKQFPNGYLGVDQFFVLSGFLMCILLTRTTVASDNFSIFHYIFGFYYRRLKRVLPLYLLVIAGSLVALFQLFPDTAYETNLKSGEKALVFMSNRWKTEAEDYFSMFYSCQLLILPFFYIFQLSTAIDIFTHTWSLSIEVQFYFIIPILYLLIEKLFHLKIYSFVFLAIVSYSYSTLFCTENEAFISLFARVWQFMIGEFYRETVTVSMKRDFRNDCNNDKCVESIVKYTSLVLMVVIILCPIELPSWILRPLFTISTGILILLSSGDTILSFPILTYIGDISYSLYLIHWPLWYLKLTDKPLLALCVVLITVNICFLEFDKIRDYLTAPAIGSRLDGLNENQTISFGKSLPFTLTTLKIPEEVARMHREWEMHDFRNLNAPSCDYGKNTGPLGWCRHKGLDGKLKLMIIGNSWAANHARIIYDECGKKAKSIVQFSLTGCEPLVSFRYNTELCIPTLKTFVDIVEKEKPDYLFLLSRMIDTGDSLSSNTTELEDDPVFQAMRLNMNRLVKHVKRKMFMLNALPMIWERVVPEILKKVKNQENLVEFDKSLISIDPSLARSRYSKLVSECPKCSLIDYKPLFYNNSTGTWRFYDVENSGLTYFTPQNHLSFHGLERVRKVYTGICDKLEE